MRFFDLLIMSINNLRRRKLRTGLTVLGVVIGTASIVVMVSLGIGSKVSGNRIEGKYCGILCFLRKSHKDPDQFRIREPVRGRLPRGRHGDEACEDPACEECVPDPGDRCESEAGSLSGIFEHCGNAQRGAGTDSAGGGRTSEQECGDSGVYRRKYGFR